MRFGLSEKTINKIIAELKKRKQIKKAVIFGSRARGDYKYNSDIDIAIYSDSEIDGSLYSDIDEAVGIYKVNLIYIKNLKDAKLRENIERDGIVIYKRDDL